VSSIAPSPSHPARCRYRRTLQPAQRRRSRHNAIHLGPHSEFDYDACSGVSARFASVANMTRVGLVTPALASEISLRPKVTRFSLGQANEALAAVKNDSIDGAAVIVP